MGFVKMLYIRGEYGMRKTAVLTMILMIFCLIGVAESADIVSNGDFEDWTGNDPNSWTTIGSGITITSNTSITYQGTSSASVELTTSIQENTDFSQTVSVQTGGFSADDDGLLGKLSFTWPKYDDDNQNVGDDNYNPEFPFGFGLNYKDK